MKEYVERLQVAHVDGKVGERAMRLISSDDRVLVDEPKPRFR